MLTLGSREPAVGLRADHRRLLGEAHHREEERMTFNICGARLKARTHVGAHVKVYQEGRCRKIN
jgi:hypothetical protein